MQDIQLNSKWNSCLDFIHDNVEQEIYNTWFSGIIPLTYQNNCLTLQVKSNFVCEYLEDTYAELLSAAICKYFGNNTNLEYEVLIDKGSSSSKGTIKTDAQQQNIAENGTMLYRNYLFDNFIEGQSNKLARTASLAVAEKPGTTSFNPLFLCGSSGVGKTHLATAIGHRVQQLDPTKKVIYVSAHLFHAQYVSAALNNNTYNFISWYQDFDVLIIDDIQELINKEKTQNTFFHIFNNLHLNQKQIIMTSDRLPKDMLGMEERLITRFKWGLVAQIDQPDFNLRRDILAYHIKKDGIKISNELIDYMATNIQGSVRDLEGVLTSLLAHSIICGNEINKELIDKVIGNNSAITKKELTIDSILDTVCHYYDIDVKDIQTKSRKREIVQARQICMYIAKQHLDLSLSQIGAYIGGRDHATVLHACNTVKDQVAVDKSFRNDLEKIESKLL